MKSSDKRADSAVRWFKTLIDAIPALRHQAEDWEEGFGAGRDFEPGRSSSASDPTAARATTNPEGAGLADQCAGTAEDIQAWLRQGQHLSVAALRLLPFTHPVAEMLARHAEVRFNGAGECIADAEWVEGVTTRLKRGLCPACYQRWYRAGKPEPLTTWATNEWHRNGLCGQRECRHQLVTANDQHAPQVAPDGVPSASTRRDVRPHESGAA